MSEPYHFPYMHIDPPGPNRKIRWEGLDGVMHEQDAPAEQRYFIPGPKPTEMDEQRIRAFIREEVERALHPTGLPDVREHRRVEMVEESGKHWRGILYAVEEKEL